MNANPNTFQPMNVNFGLMPDINTDLKKKKYIKGRERRKSNLILQLTHLKNGSRRLTFNFLSRIQVYLYDHQLFHLC